MSTASATITAPGLSAFDQGKIDARRAFDAATLAGYSLRGSEGAFRLWDFSPAHSIAEGAPEMDAYMDGWYEVAFELLS